MGDHYNMPDTNEPWQKEIDQWLKERMAALCEAEAQARLTAIMPFLVPLCNQHRLDYQI